MSARREDGAGVLVIVAAEGPGYLYGGVGRHVCEILPRLRRRHRTILVCVPSYCLAGVPEACGVAAEAGGDSLILLDPGHVASLRTHPFDLRRYEDAAERLMAAVLPHMPSVVDALLLEDHYDTGLALRLANALQVRRLVAFAHLPLSARFSYFEKGVDEERQQVLEAAALMSAATILVPSEAARRTVGQVYPIPPDRITVAPLGVSIDGIPARLDDRALRIATVGRFTEQKGWAAWLQVAELVERGGDAPIWTLVGEGPRRAHVLERLRQFVPASRIEWFPRVEANEALPALLADSAVFFLPSAHETFGLAALEAASQGAVPVLGDIAAVAEIWGDAAMVFPLWAPHVAAAQIAGLLRSQELRAAAARRAQLHARRHSWDKHADRLETVCLLE